MAIAWQQHMNNRLKESVLLMRIASYLRVQPWVIAAIFGSWAIGFVLWGFTGELVCALAAYVYPVYASFKAVEDGSSQRKTGWLIYWITFYSWCCAEAVAYRFVAWFPGYHLVKLLFILALSVPNAGGAQQLYAWILRPVFQRHRPNVDRAIAQSAAHIDVGACLQMASRATGAAVSVVLQQGSAGEPPVDCGAVQEIVIEELKREAVAQVDKIRAVAAAAPRSDGASRGVGHLHQNVVELPSPARARTGARSRAATPPPRAITCITEGALEVFES